VLWLKAGIFSSDLCAVIGRSSAVHMQYRYSRDSSVDTGIQVWLYVLEPRIRGPILGRDQRFLCSAQRSHRLWGHRPVQRVLLVQPARSFQKWSHTFIQCRGSEWMELHRHSPICLHDVHRVIFIIIIIIIITDFWGASSPLCVD
jgi:hypothetical protein